MLARNFLLSLPTGLSHHEIGAAGLHRRLDSIADCLSRPSQPLEYADIGLIDGAAPIPELLQEGQVFIVAVSLNLLCAARENVKLPPALQLLEPPLMLLVVPKWQEVVQPLLEDLVYVEAAIAKVGAHSLYYSPYPMLATRLTKVLRKLSFAGGRPIVMSEAVRQALEKHLPVVALESTIISHGMPYPQNLECAKHLERIITEQQATPATIAIMDSKIHIGLSNKDLERLAEEGSRGAVRKISRRDLAYCLANNEIGATTVSATMICSHMAGIDVFATGGIGGVHRGVEETWDISADLTELGRTPVTVVSAGVKSILDIPKTLEYLETEGVPVVTFNSDEFPAFYTDKSGVKSPLRADSERKIAELIFRSHQLRLQNGMLVAVPNPQPADAELINKAIQSSLAEMRSKGIKGHQVTPFLLKSVSEKTAGKSLESNLALVANNARVAARIAVELSQLKQTQRKTAQEAKRKPTTTYLM